jgi:digeranylgeranylglycerophospholipid reductase
MLNLLICWGVFMGWDVVVGAGPAGCSVAEKIAKAGFKVLVLEEHKRVGEPVQCAGLVSPRTLELSGFKSRYVNLLKGALVHGPAGEVLDCRGNKSYAVAIERAEFDRHLAENAAEQGTSLLLEAKARAFAREKGEVRVEYELRGKNYTARAKLLIGADGANSIVSKWADLKPPKEKIRMFAAEVELKNPFPETVDLFLGSDVAPGWFAWIIPLDKKRARIGSGSSFSGRPILDHVKALFEKYPERFKNIKLVKYTGGLVPIGRMKNFAANVMLVGDAACQTKPISGGGLYLGLRGTEICARVAIEALWQEDFSQEFLSKYQVQWNRELGFEIEKGLKYRRMFLEISDKEISNIIGFLNTKFWRRLILKKGDIDFPSLLGEKLFMAPVWADKYILSCIRKIVPG